MVYSPNDIPKAAADGKFDLLVCDEAHRLRRRKGISFFGPYDNNNTLLGLPKEATELDWLIQSSNMQVLFYDSEQSVKPSDITPEQFNQIMNTRSTLRLGLKSQLRCLGGEDYIAYVKNVLNSKAEKPHGPFLNYDLRFFENVDLMADEINRLDGECGLSCCAAGYAWDWKTKGKPKDTEIRDIDIGRGYIWNRTGTDWINSDRLSYEVGCIHTLQGYDLNYIGVIIGKEITYDFVKKRIDVVYANYRDRNGRMVEGNMDALRAYIVNIYVTLMTRGIRGCFVYVCDDALREYLRPYFDAGKTDTEI